MAQIDAKTHAQLLTFAAQNKVVLIDFHATWCPPCVRIGPYVHQACSQQGVALAKVDVDANSDSAAHYGVQAMPTFHVIDGSGKSIYKVTGGSQANVNACIAKVQEYLNAL